MITTESLKVIIDLLGIAVLFTISYWGHKKLNSKKGE